MRLIRQRKSKPYFVSYSHYSGFGKENGIKSFNTFREAQDFAVKVDKKKTYTLNSWGSKKMHR